jgi:hypothetical protein
METLPACSVRKENGIYRLLVIPTAEVFKFNDVQDVVNYIEIYHSGEITLWDTWLHATSRHKQLNFAVNGRDTTL